jgi:hypothetical protein
VAPHVPEVTPQQRFCYTPELEHVNQARELDVVKLASSGRETPLSEQGFMALHCISRAYQSSRRWLNWDLVMNSYKYLRPTELPAREEALSFAKISPVRLSVQIPAEIASTGKASPADCQYAGTFRHSSNRTISRKEWLLPVIKSCHWIGDQAYVDPDLKHTEVSHVVFVRFHACGGGIVGT